MSGAGSGLGNDLNFDVNDPRFPQGFDYMDNEAFEAYMLSQEAVFLQPRYVTRGVLGRIEVEVKVPASKAWALYGTLEITKLIAEKIVDAVDVIEGDGGPNTILKVTFKPGLGFVSYIEKYTKVDNVNMVKEAEVVEGGFLDIGFNLYRIRMEIKGNPKDDSGSSCVTKVTIEYEVKEEFAANASFVTIEPILELMRVANEHLLQSN